MWWSWALGIIGLISLWQIEKMDRKGFLTGLAVEVLWVAYAFRSHQWGFLPCAVVYTWFYWRGWRRWGRVSSQLAEVEHMLETPEEEEVLSERT
jgi:hypothetical protein